MLKLHNLSESLDRLASDALTESYLTEAYNESFPKWLSDYLTKSKKVFGVFDRAINGYKDDDWANSSKAEFKMPKKSSRYSRSTQRKLNLFHAALEKGFFDVTVHESAVPSKNSEIPTDPYVPIWGFANGQVYIPGFNDRERFSYYQSQNIPAEYEPICFKLVKKAFGDISTKALREASLHFAWFDSRELPEQERKYKEKVDARDSLKQSMRNFYSEHPEYARGISGAPASRRYYSQSYNPEYNKERKFKQSRTPAGWTANTANVDDETLNYGSNRWLYSRGIDAHLDASGYLVNPRIYDKKLEKYKTSKLKKYLHNLYDDVVKANSVLKLSMLSADIFDKDTRSSIVNLNNAIKDCAEYYNNQAKYIASSYFDEWKAADILKELQNLKSWKLLSSEVNNLSRQFESESVDWLS